MPINIADQDFARLTNSRNAECQEAFDRIYNAVRRAGTTTAAEIWMMVMHEAQLTEGERVALGIRLASTITMNALGEKPI